MEGTEEVTVEGNMFQRLDSNAISINGYNQRTSIAKNEFVWLGQSAITSWGEIGMGNDGTGGSFPRYTSVTDNLVHEIGHLQKQSSFYFQAITAEATISGNIVYNIPRAGINFNDGFGGGAKVSNNLMFNTCRESGDHGAFNSWDRLPYLTTVADGVTATTVPAMNDVHNNFIVANYAADGGCLDNDDGSAYYSIHHNFCVFGGHKQVRAGSSVAAPPPPPRQFPANHFQPTTHTELRRPRQALVEQRVCLPAGIRRQVHRRGDGGRGHGYLGPGRPAARGLRRVISEQYLHSAQRGRPLRVQWRSLLGSGRVRRRDQGTFQHDIVIVTVRVSLRFRSGFTVLYTHISV